MTNIYVKSSKAIIKLITSDNLIKNIVNDDFFTSYIPSVEVLIESEVFDATITIEENQENSLIIDYPNVYYGYKKMNIKDIISLIEYIFERSRQEKGIICIHGSGAIINDKLVACFGTTTGMGKTSLALSLASTNMFYSDEKVLIDLNSCTCAGRIKNQYVSNDYWKSKYGDVKYYQPNKVAEDKPYKVGLFVEPIICDQKEYILDKWSSAKFLWHLYEESSRKIRGTSRILFDNTYPVMSLDTYSLGNARLELIKKFTSKISAIYYKGNIDEIVKIIEEKLH